MAFYRIEVDNLPIHLDIEEDNEVKACKRVNVILSQHGISPVPTYSMCITKLKKYGVTCILDNSMKITTITVGATDEEDAKSMALKVLKQKGYENPAIAPDLGGPFGKAVILYEE